MYGLPITVNFVWFTAYAAAAAAKSLQSCPTLCDPIDGSPPGSPVPGILQARTLEWVAIAFSRKTAAAAAAAMSLLAPSPVLWVFMENLLPGCCCC